MQLICQAAKSKNGSTVIDREKWEPDGLLFLIVYRMPTKEEKRMNKILIYLFLFFIGSMAGWVIELFFRRYYSPDGRKYKRWVNPGFLTGPYVPLYGFGLCMLYLLSGMEITRLFSNDIIGTIVTIIIMAVAATVIELISGLIFVRGMHIELWDYSNEWMNFKGIVCPLFSFFWAAGSAAYYFLIHPHILSALAWLSKNLAFSFFIGLFYGIFIIDVCYTFNIMVKIKRFADENEIIVRLEALKYHLSVQREDWKEKYKFLFSLSTNRSMSEIFEAQYEKFSKIKELTIKRHRK